MASKRILVVDDDEMIRFLICEILQDLFEVEAADNQEKTFEKIRCQNGNFDLAILDLILSKDNGLQIANRLAIEWPSIRILIMSGRSDLLSQIAFFPKLAKPFSHGELINKIQEILAEKPQTK